jgi:hypothetical protein
MNASRLAARLRLPIGLALFGLVLGPARGARAQAASPDALACVPSCRTGFICWKGQCISACNPVCGANEKCTAGGECVALQGVPAPVLASVAPPPQPVAAAPVFVTAPSSVPVAAPPVQPPGADVPSAWPLPPAKLAAGGHRHNGFYLRLGLGLAAASSAADAVSTSSDVNGAGVEMQSFAVPLELALGGTPAPGFVIGVGSYGSIWPAPQSTLKNNGHSFESQAGPVLVSSIGPFADYYFDPEKGLHAQIGAAFASATAKSSTDSGAAVRVPARDFSGTGGSVMVGLGWESWIGQEWSAGILGRVQYGEVELKSEGSSDKLPTSFLVLGALATFTYH